MTTKPPEATVVAVCLSPEPGVPKYPQPSVAVGPHGIEGDYHAGPTRVRRGETVPNTRHVSLVAREVIEEVNRALGTEIPAGGLGENVLVRGLGDLGDLLAGQRLRFSSGPSTLLRTGVELEVTGQNDPCKNLCVYHPQAPKHLYGRRGVVAVVITPGTLRPGDSVELIG